MIRVLTTLFAGLLAGAGLAFMLMRGAPPEGMLAPEPAVVRDIVEVPVMTMGEAESHRADRFERIRTIEDTLALPGDFSQTEALYVLAGRADSAEVQALMHQANRIADPTDRDAALTILFLRLAELDPQSALTMSRMREFTSSRGLENVIWRTWSKLDLDAAIAAAQKLQNPAEKHLAAQTMLAAPGYMGNEVTDRIEAELGVAVSNSARARYLINIADRSAKEAISYIDRLPPAQRREAMQWLAGYLGQRDPSQARGYASLISDPGLRKIFESSMTEAMAQLDPERILNDMPTGGLRGAQARQYLTAMNTLAASDIERALSFYDGIASRQTRQMFAHIIATELARQDVDRAVAWAQEAQNGRDAGLLMNVLAQVATTEPDLALSKIDLISNREWRRQTLINVVSTVAQNDPRRAIGYLDEITDQRTRSQATRMVVSQWAGSDPEAAINWILGNDVPDASQLLSEVSHAVIAYDIGTALRMLPRLDDEASRMWRPTIASSLAVERGAADAQQFVDQFKGEPDYEYLQAAMINGVAQQDVYLARRLAEQLPPGPARDRSMHQLISNHVHSDPQEAAAWLNAIADVDNRSSATRQVLRQWFAMDAPAASQWIMNHPAGRIKDDAILGTLQSQHQHTPSAERLVAFINDPGKRLQAEIGQIWRIAATDRARARSMIEEIDMSPEQRQQLRAQFDQR